MPNKKPAIKPIVIPCVATLTRIHVRTDHKEEIASGMGRGDYLAFNSRHRHRESVRMRVLKALTEPGFSELSGDPRYGQLLQKIDFPKPSAARFD